MAENFNPDVQQAYSDTCAIKSQQLILNDFGIPCTEDDLVRTSIEQGWYDGNGTSMQDVNYGTMIQSQANCIIGSRMYLWAIPPITHSSSQG